MNRLAVFDIDGTLTDTNDVDDECFLLAVSSVLGLDVDSLDWSEAPHITDSSLLSWLCRRYCGRPVLEHEAFVVQSRFLEFLEAERDARPARFRAIAGADTALRHLGVCGWKLALATGGWSHTARLKLDAAGFDADSFVIASASDATTRRDIMQLAVLRASDKSQQPAFSRIVSVGDGLWDVEAAASLQWPFVGIATDQRAARLRAAGAQTVLPDLVDRDAVKAALESAGPPQFVAGSRHGS
jgi:phosphoglycolate phosphatase-like HAD superfamily hydrolase